MALSMVCPAADGQWCKGAWKSSSQLVGDCLGAPSLFGVLQVQWVIPVGGMARVAALGMAFAGMSELEACLSGWDCWVASVRLSARCHLPCRGCCVVGGGAVPAELAAPGVGCGGVSTGCPCLWVSCENTKQSRVWIMGRGLCRFAFVYGLMMG